MAETSAPCNPLRMLGPLGVMAAKISRSPMMIAAELSTEVTAPTEEPVMDPATPAA